MLSLFLTHLEGYKKEAAKSPLFIVLEVFCELLLPLVMAEIVDVAIPAGDTGYIFLLGALMLVLVPPHAGLAFGLDRMVMLMAKADSIREVIAFPKVKDASCLMTDAPNLVDDVQLEELGIAIVKNEE